MLHYITPLYIKSEFSRYLQSPFERDIFKNNFNNTSLDRSGDISEQVFIVAMAPTMTMSILLLSSMFLCVYGRPGGIVVAGGAAIAKPLVVLDGGNVGVNFGGYSASAGLGGLLSGDVTRGGLHAEAGTPYGQAAAAGLGGAVGGAGYAAGGLYAGATAGGGVLAGTSLSGEKVIYQPEQVLSEKTVTEEAKVVYEQKLQAAPVVHRTIIEKTVIPNYVEKTIQVPSYVEKTIRVPTVIEKTVRVEAEPTVYEKTIEVPAHHVSGIATGVVGTGQIGVNQQATFQVTKPAAVGFQKRVFFGPAVFYPRRPVGFRKRVHFGTYGYPTGGFVTNIFGGGGGAIGGGAYGAGALGGGGTVSSVGVGGASAGTSAGGSATFYKQTNPTLFNDIFNIPISALGAVNNLLNNIGGQAGGGIAVSKGYSVGSY